MFRSNRRAAVAEIAQVNAVSDGKMSEYTVQCSLLCMGLHSQCWPLSTTESANSGHVSIRTGPQSNGRRWPGLMNQLLLFFFIMLMAESVCVAL